MSVAALDLLPDRQKLFGRASDIGAVAAYAAALALYGAIVAVAIGTLTLVLIRQANPPNFNALVATLEQRDRVEASLPQVLDRLRRERDDYAEVMRQPVDCFSPTVATSRGAATGRHPAAAALPSAAGPLSVSCADLGIAIRNHANELRLAEDQAMFKIANSGAYYLDYIDGITQKTPEIIPALQILDAHSNLVKSWARSPFELIQMFLLVSMGMLGGMVNVTRWLVGSNMQRPPLLAYFYKPAVGGAIALGAFVVFKASQLVIVGPGPEGGSTVTASVFLLAGLGLVSGFCADKALRQIEKAADAVFSSQIGAGQEMAAQEVARSPAHLQVVMPAADRHAGVGTRKPIRSVSRAGAYDVGTDVPGSDRSPEAARD